jgi:hypothetical protein
MATFIPCTRGYLHRVERFERADRRGNIVVASVDLPELEAVDTVEFDANLWDEAMLDMAPVIPARPGYYVLESSKDADGSIRSVKIDVIGWRLVKGTVLPITVHALHQVEEEPFAILCPDGHVEYSDGGIGPNVEDFLNEVRVN